MFPQDRDICWEIVYILFLRMNPMTICDGFSGPWSLLRVSALQKFKDDPTYVESYVDH